jgi:hypothetical protein
VTFISSKNKRRKIFLRSKTGHISTLDFKNNKTEQKINDRAYLDKTSSQTGRNARQKIKTTAVKIKARFHFYSSLPKVLLIN